MSAFVAAPTAPPFAAALRFVRRELRGGLSGFRIFVACIALGVAAIAGVGSVTRGITEGIAREGGTILGGDLSFTLSQRMPSSAEAAFLDGQGRTSTIASLRSMARTGDGATSALVEIKAVDDAYPLSGTVAFEQPVRLADALAPRPDGRFGVAVDPLLLARLDAAVGDAVTIGRATMVVTATVAAEPDKIGSGIDFGPRVMMSRAALDATGLVQPGSLVRWQTRLKLAGEPTDERVAAVRTAVEAAFPEAGWRIASRDDASPGLKRNVERFAEFLTLVGLTALVVGGVGVTNAVKAFVDRKRDSIAAFKALGAPGGFVVGIYLIEIQAITAIGVAIGLAAGLLLATFGGDVLAAALDLPIEIGVYPSELALAALYGVVTALAFALWALGRAHDVPVAALFRDRVAPERRWPRWRYRLATAAAVVALAALTITAAYDRFVATVFVAAIAVTFVLLAGVAHAVMAAARRAPPVRSTGLRLALRNIHRPGGLTLSVILSLGLGLALLVTLALIDGSLRAQLTSTIPEKAPNFFFLDVQSTDADGFAALVEKTVPGTTLERVPMLRGRLTALKGVPVDKIDAPPDSRWALDGERGVTYADTPPRGGALAEGTWWAKDYSGPPLVSFEAELADRFGLKVGDDVTVNVLGRELTARIANTRRVEWESLAINFVMVFSPNTFAGAPHSVLATAALPGGGSREQEAGLMKAVVAAYPTATVVRVKDVLSAVNDLVGDLVLAIRAAASVALVASVLVLAGALASGHRQRIYDAVLLKTFGATRARVLAAFVAEYMLLGLAAALFGIVAGTAAAYGVLEGIMKIPPVLDLSVAALAAGSALVLTVGFGLVGTWRILGRKAAPVLRDL
ncbi:ABC transporter permease [Oharaeibacter diazotrophicus]|uniref:Putative ABC transport system permease protein n=1 Tax=Oharaeibacter diazotrophicus TaxID=1920512 RepID=A0A4R6RDS6_9HYPH|nr:FtsX-like permease family protein [Oharaeibacter diazotrophicus]TDP84373.1 putative ABC transport system permease protein [Oharaeibacter diazotrophicus]BBE73410.1 macrolide export ATP-binding/permease protein MacB [Pleomorphomonas sp. SM30]GLS75202.1 glycosyl transferase family 1 [Oharaeibacter diazotrophicus]